MRKKESPTSREFFRLHAEICRAIAHPKRLEILNLLRQHERSVSQLAERMGIPSANVSQQLTILRQAGVIRRRSQGTSAYYRIVNPKIVKAFDLMTEVLEQKIDAGIRALREKSSKKRTT